MEYVVFSVIVLIINNCFAGQLNVTENPIISTRFSSSEHKQTVYFTAVINQSLDVHFQNMTACHGWCDDYYFNYNNILETPIVLNSVIHVKNVTYDMSTTWKCIVITQQKTDKFKKYVQYFVYFNLHVKGAKFVQLFVNESAVSFSPADLSAPYDGEAIYFYENDEHINIVCRNVYKTGTVLLEYFKKGVITVSYNATFAIHLHSKSNNSYIDCVYGTTKPVDKYVYRVTFVIKNQLFDLTNRSNTLSDAQQSVNQATDSGSSLLIVGSSVGVVLIILGMIGVACWYRRTRNVQHVETPYGDITNENGCPTPQITNECEIEYDYCHNEGVYNIDPEDHYYAKINYAKCKQEAGEAKTRSCEVYDEPYVE